MKVGYSLNADFRLWLLRESQIFARFLAVGIGGRLIHGMTYTRVYMVYTLYTIMYTQYYGIWCEYECRQNYQVSEVHMAQ